MKSSLFFSLDRDASGKSPVSPGISDAHSPCAFDAVQSGPSTLCEATGINQVVGEKEKKKKINLSFSYLEHAVSFVFESEVRPSPAGNS